WESTLARTTRASCGTYRKPIANTSTGREVPNTATNTAARAVPGKDITTSSTRITTSERNFAPVAAIEPITAAASSAPAVAARPISSEERAPWVTREQMSRPSASVPIQCSALGGCTGVPVARGPCGLNSGAKTATTASRARKRTAMRLAQGRAVTGASGLPLTDRRRDPSVGRMSDAPDPGVDDDVQQVHGDVHDDEGDRDHEGHSLHQEHVVAGDAVEDELAHGLDVEDDLDDHRTAHEVAHPQAEHRDRDDQGVAQHVAADDHGVGDPRADGGAHVVAVELLDHRGADHPGEGARHRHPERE